MSKSLQALQEHIDSLWLVDTHEHITPEQDWLAADQGLIDFSWLFVHYAAVDLRSAGMSKEALDRVRGAETPLAEKWELFEPYWELAKNTSYCKAVDRAVRELYDLPGLSRETFEPLARRMREARKAGFYRHVLKDRARIAVSIIDIGTEDVDRKLFAPVSRMDPFIWLRRKSDITALEEQCSASIQSLDDLVDVTGAAFGRKREAGSVGVKSGLAYSRTLDFGLPSKRQATEAFDALLRGEDDGPGGREGVTAKAKPLQDYMFHQVVGLCADHDFPMQIHTGIQEGNGNWLTRSNPVLLTSVIAEHPNARFDLFHAGYPYWAELGVLGKMFPGVHADLCWTNVITPAASMRALDEWLELMPASKIFAFGGDYRFVEGAYIHSVIARRNVAKVLSAKVDSGYFTLDEATRIAGMILRDNPARFFGLTDRLPALADTMSF